jgi:transposase-like protein
MGEFPRKSDGRRVFTVEFKRGVVQQLLKGEKTLAEVSRELDIQPSVVRAGAGSKPNSASSAMRWPNSPLPSTTGAPRRGRPQRGAPCSRRIARCRLPEGSVPAAPAGGGVWGWGRDGLGTGARGRGARARRALMLPSLPTMSLDPERVGGARPRPAYGVYGVRKLAKSASPA